MTNKKHPRSKQARGRKETPIEEVESEEEREVKSRKGNKSQKGGKSKRGYSHESYEEISLNNNKSKYTSPNKSPHKYGTRNNQEVKTPSKLNLKYSDYMKLIEIYFMETLKNAKEKIFLNDTVIIGDILDAYEVENENVMKFKFASVMFKDKFKKKLEIEAGQCIDF